MAGPRQTATHLAGVNFTSLAYCYVTVHFRSRLYEYHGLVVFHAKLFLLVVTASLLRASAPICSERAAGETVQITRLRSDEDRAIMSVAPHGKTGGEASLMWHGDLNRDGQDDLILRFHELCGNAGECPWAVYAGCGEDRYVSVWGPADTVTLQVAAAKARRSVGWVDLYRTMRTTTVRRDYASRHTLRFQNGAYRMLRGSSKRLP